MGLFTLLKGFLKRFLPPPTNTFNREMGHIREILDQQQNQIVKQLAQQQKEIDAQQRQLRSLEQQIITLKNQILKKNEEEKKEFEIVHKQSIDASRYASESVWAAIFNNTITDSEWLKNKSFSPGRWAVGYAFLYVLYRVLEETQPKNILELGLGQSTKMIAQYSAANINTRHYVVEGDADWAAFFCKDFHLTENTELVYLNYEMIPYKEAEKVRIFSGFQEKFSCEKFDLISIDAPLGGDMKQYARIDVLNLLPDCISKDFVIMIDDCERKGEANTVAEMENKLKETGILYKIGRYRGKKDFVLITAEHMGFLTSM